MTQHTPNHRKGSLFKDFPFIPKALISNGGSHSLGLGSSPTLALALAATVTLALPFVLASSAMAQEAITQEASTQETGAQAADTAPVGETLQARVIQACPSFWEDPHTEIDLSQRTGDYWEGDAEGRAAFVAYLQGAMSDDPVSAAALELMVEDRLTVATECATARVGLLQFQMESMPNDLLIAMNSVGNGLGEAIGEAVGFSAANPGRSCKDIKERYADAVDGSYWINVSNNQPGDSMEVFCDMTTDGGGWTLAAYLGSGGSRIPNGFWVEPVSAEHYDINRSPIATDYSLGILDEMDDTEMVIVGNTPDIASADGLNGLIQFRYPVSSPTFNNALLPHLDSLFEMRRKLDSDYQQGKLLSTSRTHFWMVQNTQSQSQFYISVNGNSGYYYSPGYRATQLWFYVR